MEDLGDIELFDEVSTTPYVPVAATHLTITQSPPPKTEPYNAGKAMDEARRKLAYLLAWLLAVICCFTLFCVAVGADFDHLKGILELVIGPVGSLVGAATGFYFGSQAK
ncbi:hypothetical protein [Luteibacter aegosomatissinici]|uniref:hypothetical protein n=1 Tax=Luteibacter aegosomatissinici TaxID=2911539 RepID=UPI001FF7C423|nr:hypothetical protein [Luteibacter aegosomatissinici]UPG92870.1 hypothetical protein L2Y97_13445 [Luteibacter aegosomatissinici]